MNLTHILNEAASPVSSPVWHMWCGLAVIALDNGNLIPDTDFHLEAAADKADCPPCRKTFAGRVDVRDIPCKSEA